MPRLSAGRVQSVATRLVVERERERMQFVAAVVLGHRRHLRPGRVRGEARRGRRASASPRAATSATTASSKGDLLALDEDAARVARSRARGRAVRCALGRGEAVHARSPAAPFMTSTLQQEASRKLRFSSQTTMRVAQRLYENGYITYMRTDSTTLSESALTAARAQAAAAVRRRVRPGGAAPLRAQGEERAGGTRGDPARRRRVPHARRRGSASCRATSTRCTTCLEAHGRVADGGRARADVSLRLGATASERARTPSSAPRAR